jgi:hypothetical protein
MNFSTYLYQVGISFQKFFNIQSPKPPQYNRHYFSPEKEAKLREKCQKAAQEITYLKSFNHWPLATSKQNISGSTIHRITKKYRKIDSGNKYVDHVIMIKCKDRFSLPIKYYNRNK